jgi:hypothetical protein
MDQVEDSWVRDPRQHADFPRNLFDIAIGHDNIFHSDRYRWGLRLAIVNLTNKYALYNFISTFSGTHYVTPRAVTGTVSFRF